LDENLKPASHYALTRSTAADRLGSAARMRITPSTTPRRPAR